MTNWDDFQRQFDRTNIEIGKTGEALEKMRAAFESLSETYQKFIVWCEEYIKRQRRFFDENIL